MEHDPRQIEMFEGFELGLCPAKIKEIAALTLRLGMTVEVVKHENSFRPGGASGLAVRRK